MSRICPVCGQPIRPTKAERWAPDRALLAKVKSRADEAEGVLSWRRFAEWLGLDPIEGAHLSAVADGKRGLSKPLRAAIEEHNA